MIRAERAAALRWVTGSIVAIIALLLALPLQGRSPLAWVIPGSVMVVAGLIHYTGIRTREVGKVSFVPTAALMAYFALGLPTALFATTLGLIVWGLLHALRDATVSAPQSGAWWRAASHGWLVVAQNGLGLLAAHFVLTAAAAPAPITGLNSLPELVPIIGALTFYLLAFDLPLAVDVLLRGLNLRAVLGRHGQLVASMQILPLLLAPFAAIASADLGSIAFLIFEGILLTLAVVVKRLAVAQDSLREQLAQLGALASVNQSLRSNLELAPLLETAYEQVARLLKVNHMMVVLRGDDGSPDWQVRFVSHGGRVLSQPSRYRLDGLAHWVLTQRVPLYASSVPEVAAQLGIRNPPQADTWMGVPLMGSQQVIGCIAVWIPPLQQPDRVFDEHDRDIFTAIVVQTEMALQNSMLYQGVQQHAAQLARLNEISTLLNSSLNPEEVLQLIVSSVVEVAGCSKAALYLLDGDDARAPLVLTENQGFSAEFVLRPASETLPLTATQRRSIIQDRQTVLVSHVAEERGRISTGALRLAAAEGIAAYACLPLSVQNQPIGLLAVFYEQPHHFGTPEIELLETFANQAALAVANARVFQQVDVQLSRRAGQITRMAEVSRSINATLDLTEIFNAIVRAAMEGCGADTGLLLLCSDPETGEVSGEVRMAAWQGFDAGARRMPHHIAEEFIDSEVLRTGTPGVHTRDGAGEAGPRSQLSAPVALDGAVIGALVLESERPHAFGEEDLSFVQQLTIQASAAIRNGQLYRQAQRVRDRLRATLDASSDGLLMIDDQARLVMANARMQDFWNAERAGAGIPQPSDRVDASTLRVLSRGLGYEEDELAQLLDAGRRFRLTTSHRDRSVTQSRGGQRQRYVERSVRPVHDDEGQFIGILLVFRDVTEQQELEQARQDLTSMVVHELRAPLQAVMGSMRLISEVAPPDTPLIHQATGVSQRAVKKLLNLINNLLDVSRMEKGEFVLDPTLERVEPLLHDAVEELAPLAEESDVSLDVQIAPDLPPVQIDRDMIDRVILNLVDNALKYTQPGTAVTLSAEVRQAGNGAHQRPGVLAVSVADRGPGVPDEFKASIFDRFSQIAGRRGRRRGAGLGLAFCKLAVESHGGEIWVEDNPQGGSIFIFTLPAAATPPRPDERRQRRSRTAPRR